MAAVCGKFENSNELCSRRFPFKLVSVLSSRCTLPFLLYSHADYISFPFKLANRFLKPANRPAHSSVIRHGSDESVVFPRKIEGFLSHSSVHEAFACSTLRQLMGPATHSSFFSLPFSSHLIPLLSSFSNYRS